MKKLFNRSGLNRYLASQTSKVQYAISMLDIGQVSTIINNNRYEEFVKEYYIIAPDIFEKKATRHSRPVIIEDNNRFDYPISDKTRPDRINGTRHTMEIPFEGDQNLFLFRPSKWGFEFTLPSGLIKVNMLILQFDQREYDKEKLDREIDTTLEKIYKFLDLIKQDIDYFRRTLLAESQQYIRDRYDELRLNSGLPNNSILGINKYPDLDSRRSRGGRGLDL